MTKPSSHGPLTADEIALADETEDTLDTEIKKGRGSAVPFQKLPYGLPERVWEELERRYSSRAGTTVDSTATVFSVKVEKRQR